MTAVAEPMIVVAIPIHRRHSSVTEVTIASLTAMIEVATGKGSPSADIGATVTPLAVAK